MSANSIKTAMKTVDSFLAHFTTPFGTMPTAQAIQGKDTVGAIIGLGQIGIGTVQMLGKSVIWPVSFGASVASLLASVDNMYESYTKSTPGKVNASDFYGAMSGLTSLVGVVAGVALTAVSLPAAATVAIAAAVIGSTLTAWGVVAGISNSTMEFSSAVEGFKNVLSQAGSLLGSAY
ncbi:hypothetical protein, partial [Achromobacter xylosoxidans]